MSRYRAIAIGVCCALLCALMLAAPIPQTEARAQRQTLKRVRVGFFAFDGYHMIDDHGARSGYGYELLQHLVGYTNWELEYVGYDKSWNDMQSMLANGEIDLLTSAQKTPERIENFEFSNAPIGTSAAIVTVKSGDIRYAMADYSNWSGIRVGMILGNSRNDDFAEFADTHGFTYEAVYYASTDELVSELQAGERIDAILTSNLRAINNEWIIAEFNASNFYIMVQKGNTELLSEINEALTALFTYEQGLRTRLMNKYYAPSTCDEISYTIQERAYIARMSDTELTAIINPDRAPFSYFEDGQVAGIIGDIANEISSRAKLNIRIVETRNREEHRALAESGDIDIRFDAWHDYTEAEDMGYRLTMSYLDVTIAQLSRRNTDQFKTAALLFDSDRIIKLQDLVSSQGMQIIYYPTVEAVVNAVFSGKCDVGYLYYRSAELAVKNDETNQLIAEHLYGYDYSFAVAVNKNQDRLLYSILSKAVASMSKNEIAALIQRNTVVIDKPFSILGFMYDYPLPIAGGLLLIFLSCVLIIISIEQSRRRRREALKLIDEKRKSELLTDALNAAERAGTAKSQFLSLVSHEMRTPLNAIIGLLSLARDSEREQAAEYIANTEVAAKQLLSVINDVLDMSAIESGKMKLAHTPFDFKHMIHDLSSMYAIQCQQKGIDFDIKLKTPVDEWLIGDPLRVNQILINLLGNAVKFTSSGSVNLIVSQQDMQNEHLFLRFEVSDTGCGISEELQARLFKPFEQENSSTAQKYGGSGLGLSIVKNLVSMMNGAISVTSAEGEGTRFVVDLPFERGDNHANASFSETVKNMRVLAIDDEESERAYISAVLNRMGVRHTCVNSGETAFEALKRANDEHDRYSACLIDWRMPSMDGAEITRQIRRRYGDDIAIIVASAYAHHQAETLAKQAGANVFVPKPLFRSSLFNLLMTLTGGGMTKQPASAIERSFPGKRVLLAEDNALNRMVAAGLMQRAGIQCDSAEDGKTVVDMFVSSAPGTYDAILMDIQMPNMDGFEATRAIRTSAHPDALTIQIIAQTANAFTEDIAKTLSSGMNAHVAKPIEPEELFTALKRAFEK